MQKVYKKSKAGISLITVLLFMMIATIAATATYKWITSEGRSSASRMLQREAYQSSIAGIENARAWMTYHANDVGALIKAYIDGGNKPVNIDDRLRTLQRAGQDYHVWLVGVNTEESTYKLKILSSGEARNNTRHSEVAIFNVDGLYQVTIPTEASTINFDKAFHGKSTGITGDDSIQSGIINGDWTTNNTPKIGNLLVTGDISYGGTNPQSGDLYVKGSFKNNNGVSTVGIEGVDTSVAYVGKNVECVDGEPFTVYGDLFVEGNIECDCQINVSGNFTVNGTLCNKGWEVKVGKNFIFTETGNINHENAVQAGKYVITGNALLPKNIEANCGDGCGDKDNGKRKASFGGKIYEYSGTNYYYIHYQRYQNGMWPWQWIYPKGEYNYGVYANMIEKQDEVSNSTDDCQNESRGECKKWRLFSIKAKEGALQTQTVSEWSREDNILKDIGDEYWENLDKMNAYGKLINDKGEVPTPILLKNVDNWKQKLANTFCNIPKKFKLTNDIVKSLNSCYEKALNEDDILYESFLPIEWEYDQMGNASEELKYKFIFYVPNKLGQTEIPPTAANGMVFFYLKSGAGMIQASTGKKYNYFIYSEGDIEEINGLQLYGSMIMANGSTLKKYQGGVKLNYDKDVVNAMATAGLIQDNPEYTALSGGASNTSTSTTTGGKDNYFISMAPQLGITLESQYENNESLPIANNETELNPSFIVLPRVIYLPSDPYGSLPDYYNILPLNGSTLKKEDVNVNCSGIPTTGKLYSGTTLAKGIFKCTAAANNHDNVPFWVVIGDDQRSTPAINFVEPSHEMPASGSHEVKVNVPAHDQQIKLNVSCPSAPEKWNYSLAASGTKDDNGKCVFVLPANNASSQVTLFTVTTTSAASGTLVFNLLSGEGYNLTSPYSAELHVSSNATLNRIEATPDDIKTYCTNSPENCPAEDLLNEWPDCNIEETWVEPSTNFGVNTRNNSWAISVGGTGELRLNPVNNDKCIIIIPQEGNSLDLSTLEVNKTYELRASIKRKKRSVKVGFKGEIDGKNPVLNISAGGRTSYCSYGGAPNDDKTCTISVFDGETISLSIDKENDTENEQFSYWKCASGSCPTTEPITSSKYNDFSVSDNETVIYAYFNEQDKHCFFEEFKENSLECSNDETEYCIDYCNGTCSGTSGGKYSKAKWHLVAGSINDVSKDYDYIRIKESIGKKGKDGSAVKVLSTVNAGLYGTMKALFQLPKATSNYGTASANISQSGFMLRSNNSATEYLMLNLYVNENGKLAAQLCTENKNNCASQFLRNSSVNEASVSTSNMIMMSATLSAENLIVSAFTGNYYGDPTEYTTTFVMEGFSNYGDRAHEFVGFSLADENFKLYGIGWKSEDYASECHDTYPTVKCSFAAVAENGIIPTEKTVKPWVGHSGWFDSENCTEKYYYYNGTDACSGSDNGSKECPSDGYSFSESGAGVHGYLEGNQEVKTAKAWLDCNPSSEEEYAWATETEIERAHCGLFWTGKISECVDDTELFSGELSISNEEKSTTFSSNSKANLRGTTLNIELENTDSAEVEIWLLSENDKWGSDDFESTPVKMSNNSASFEVEKTFSDGAEGFDPENVTAIVLKTTGIVVLKSITTKCKNAIGISNCKAEYDKELSKWIITADITNKDKVNSYNVVGRVDGSSVFSISEVNSWNENQATFEDSHNPYNSNQDKTYSITASITQGTITKETPCDKITIGKITCSDAKIDGNATIESGSKYPTFSFNLNECPPGGCPYEIYLNDTKQHSDKGTDSLNYTAQGTAPECENDNGCKYTYTVKSASSDYPFDPCLPVTFKVVKKVEPIGLSCTDFTKLTGKETSSSISITPTVSNCDGGCTYDIKLNGSSRSKGGYNSGPISFNGESEAGTKNYTLYMTRTNDNVTDSCKFSVEYKKPFEVTCGIAGDIADQTDIEQGSKITVTPYSVQGCNADCYYDIKLDGSSVIGGEQGSYDGSSVSFIGANSAGEKNYILTIYSPDKSKQKDCPFKVTYKESAGGTATCVMFANNNNQTRLPTNRGWVYFKASNFRDILSSTQETTLSCNLGVEQLIDTTTYCNPQNGSNGDCAQIELTMPSKAGLYKCSFDAGGTNLCKFEITIADPITCSVTPQTINGAEYVTFSARIDKDLQTNFDLNLHNCGFKKDGNWKDNNNNPTGQPLDADDSWTEYVSASTKFTYECTQGQISNKTCTKSVVLAAPPEITNCSELTATKSNNAVTKIVPIVNNCAENCEYHISGDETIDHNNRDWSGGSISLTTGSDVTKNYTLIVENEYGNSSPCDFNITYSSGVVCHAPAGCENPVTSGEFKFDGKCYFATKIGNINAASDANFKVNNEGPFNNYQSGDKFKDKIDGGFYIQTPIGNIWGSDITLGEPICN